MEAVIVKEGADPDQDPARCPDLTHETEETGTELVAKETAGIDGEEIAQGVEATAKVVVGTVGAMIVREGKKNRLEKTVLKGMEANVKNPKVQGDRQVAKRVKRVRKSRIMTRILKKKSKW